MSFESLKLIPPLLNALQEQGYEKPSPIQSMVIPQVLAGKDILAAAQTGTGKTAGFTLPMLQLLNGDEKPQPNQTRALILTPTRELAIQVHESIRKYAQFLPLRAEVVYGGVKINPQMMSLRKGVDLLVATPGRLLDLMEKNAIGFQSLRFLVLDEADRMLDLGFLPDIEKLAKHLPEKRQTLMFSATFSNDIKALSEKFLQQPQHIQVSPQNSTAVSVQQWMHPVDKKEKGELLLELIRHHRWNKLLVFVKTRKGANKLAYDLDKQGVKSAAIHGDKSQQERNRALEAFKQDKVQVLVATDVAARGLDIQQLPVVVNFDLPKVAEDYVHRIGRTGRAGEKGKAVSLVSADEVDLLRNIERLIRKLLPRKLVDGFEPNHSVPETHLAAIKKKKPHKKKLAKAQERQAAGKQNSNAGKSKSKKPNAKKPINKNPASKKPASKKKRKPQKPRQTQ